MAGVAGLGAGAMQADTEQADLARERLERETLPDAELEELSQIYVKRGLRHELARQVAVQLSANGALDAHTRDELGIVEHMADRPIEAAVTSAATSAVGAAMPLLMIVLSPASILSYAVAVASLLFLALLGAIGAKAGGRAYPQSHRARHLLGRICDGADRRYRGAGGDCGLRLRPLPRPTSSAGPRLSRQIRMPVPAQRVDSRFRLNRALD